MKIYLYRAVRVVLAVGILAATFAVGRYPDRATSAAFAALACLCLLMLTERLLGRAYDQYAGCCGCGTTLKVDRYAVWYGDQVDMTEAYCWRCFVDNFDINEAEGYDLSGFTYAPLGPVVTWDEYRRAANDAFADRQPFRAEVTA